MCRMCFGGSTVYTKFKWAWICSMLRNYDVSRIGIFAKTVILVIPLWPCCVTSKKIIEEGKKFISY